MMENKNSEDKNARKDKRLRAAASAVAVLLLLILVLIFVLRLGCGGAGDRGGGGRGGAGGGTDTASVDTRPVADSPVVDTMGTDSLSGVLSPEDSLLMARLGIRFVPGAGTEFCDDGRTRCVGSLKELLALLARARDSIALADARVDSLSRAGRRGGAGIGAGAGLCGEGQIIRPDGVVTDLYGVPCAAGGTGGIGELARARADSIARHIADSAALARALADSLARARADSAAYADSAAMARADSLALAEALARRIADSLARLDSLAKARADSLAMLAEIARADSAARAVNPCARDTLMPWVHADPSGGLHRKAVSVKLTANKKCKIEWSFDGVRDWREYAGQPINISGASTLYYRAVDSCGKTMDVRSKRYEFDLSGRAPPCPSEMEHVKTGNSEFCVDRYEWPNRRGAQPAAFVSLYQAMDSCFSARKRLCTSDEWTTACGGPEKWRYLYGESYEPNTCAARDTAVQRSGARPECRGYFEVFDMSGNLAEWTSTPAAQNRAFNNVMGGYWESGNQTRCADARYSYFPQNRHNPVGFRCCKDAGPQTDGGTRRGNR